MLRQQEKFKLLTFITLGLAILFMFIVLFTFNVFLLFLACYLLACSILSDAMCLYLSYQTVQSLKQWVRGFTLLCLITLLLFYTWRL